MVVYNIRWRVCVVGEEEEVVRNECCGVTAML